jgi:hypothetical protein
MGSIPGTAKLFSSLYRPDHQVPYQPAIAFVGKTLSGREANQKSPYTPEVKNAWSYTYTPPHIRLSCCPLMHYLIILPFTLFHESVIFDKLMVPHLIKKFPVFIKPNFITMLKKGRSWGPFRANSIQSTSLKYVPPF